MQNDHLFSSRLEDDDVDLMDLGSTAIDIVMSDNMQEKYRKLDVEAGLQLSVLSGMVNMKGSGSCLTEKTKGTKTQSMTLIYKLKSVNEDISVRHKRHLIDTSILTELSEDSCGTKRNVNATHVVVGIDWGAICSITCESDNIGNEDATSVKGAMSAKMKNIENMIGIGGSVGGSWEGKRTKFDKNFVFKCRSDVSPSNKVLPVTFEDAVEMARTLPDLLKRANQGKGVPLTYHLLPLERVVRMCKLDIKLNTLYSQVNEGTVKKCADVLERFTKNRQILGDIQNDVKAKADFISNRSIEIIEHACRELEKEENEFKNELQRKVKSVRSMSAESSDLDVFLNEQESEAVQIAKYDEEIKKCQEDLSKVKMIEVWRSKGINYLGKNNPLLLGEKHNVYVFYKSSNVEDNEDLQKQQDYFMRLQATFHTTAGDALYEFILLDQEISQRYWPKDIKKTIIRQYKRGSCVCYDVYAKEGQDTDLCLIQFAEPQAFNIFPPNRAFAELRCPRSKSFNGSCSDEFFHWRCSKCKEFVQYGKESESASECFYCTCGKSKQNEAFFRCNEKNHGTKYHRYPNYRLGRALSEHIEEINILILGETGVGKSTWINSFQNYIYYDDLHEAMNSPDFHVLIPASFTFTKDGKEKEIRIGDEDPNEVLEAGKSATKEPRSYVLFTSGAKIRLIDTPGIGDVEGVEQDMQNVDNILSHLTYYDEIHAVCMLLPPNKPRLTAMFRYCIQELLVQLHSSAKHNIVFCFTNARATFYEPGETLPVLNKELRDRKVGIQATKQNYKTTFALIVRLFASCPASKMECASAKTRLTLTLQAGRNPWRKYTVSLNISMRI